MTHRFSNFKFTPAVRAAQEAQGSRRAYEWLGVSEADTRDTLGEAERAFIAALGSFDLASVSETGWRYGLASRRPAGLPEDAG